MLERSWESLLASWYWSVPKRHDSLSSCDLDYLMSSWRLDDSVKHHARTHIHMHAHTHTNTPHTKTPHTLRSASAGRWVGKQCTHISTHTYTHTNIQWHRRSSAYTHRPTVAWPWRRQDYGVATVSRIDKIIGLFCRISSLLYGSFAKETYNLIDPTKQSHSIRRRLRNRGSDSESDSEIDSDSEKGCDSEIDSDSERDGDRYAHVAIHKCWKGVREAGRDAYTGTDVNADTEKDGDGDRDGDGDSNEDTLVTKIYSSQRYNHCKDMIITKI